jgi:protoheme IX farnesyltransferase
MQFVRRSFLRLQSPLAFYQVRSQCAMARRFSSIPPSADPSTDNTTLTFKPKPVEADAAPKKKVSLLKDLRMLTKWELSCLNTTVAMMGYLLVPGVQFLSLQTLWFTLAVQLMAMTSQTVNQIKEKHHDAKMVRTCMRPIPRNRVTVPQASTLAFGMWGLSNAIFYTCFPINGLLVANTILFSYILMYTPMKRTSENNTAIGSLVGALPPLLGWVSAGGSLVSMVPWNLVLFMFAWQFPHFYGILWTYRNDYDNQDYKMIQDPTKASTIMKAAIGAMWASVAMLTAAGSFSLTGAAAMTYLLYADSYKSVVNFEKDPNVQNAKMLKRKAYLPFTVFFVVVLLNILGLTPEQLYKRSFAKTENE